MNKTLRISLIVVGILVTGFAILVSGIFIGGVAWNFIGAGPARMMGNFINSGYLPQFTSDQSITPATAYRGMGPGMMGWYTQDNPDWSTCGGFAPGYGPGAGGTRGFGMMGPGMMGGYGYPGSGGCSTNAPAGVEPLSIEQAEQAVADYLASLDNTDLILEEVMIFDNHAYAEIYEESTGIGAMEVLVDPVTLEVYPEHGPNMMWNLKYGMMSGFGGYGMMGRGMMGGLWRGGNQTDPADLNAEMPVSPEQAQEIAQEYLDQYLPGVQADEHADRFYGYYTLHITQDGQTTGMLSVNGYSGQVFPHTWHGDFIEMSEEE